MYTLVMTIDHRYWDFWKQGKASTSGPAMASQNKANTYLAALFDTPAAASEKLLEK